MSKFISKADLKNVIKNCKLVVKQEEGAIKRFEEAIKAARVNLLTAQTIIKHIGA